MTNQIKQSTTILQGSQRKLWLDILIEVGLIVAVYIVYSVSRGSLPDKASVAFDNAKDIISLEKAIGIFIEQDVQSFFLESTLWINIVNSIYTYCYFPALIGFAIWAYWRHRNKYKVMRTVFIISAVLAFIIFAIYPVAPPRFFNGIHYVDNLGFVDTLAQYWNSYDVSIQALYNPYAAMPSLHQGWTLMIGIGLIWMSKSWIVRALGIALPTVVFVSIVATGNHFILDAVGGAIIIAISIILTMLLAKLPIRNKHQVVTDLSPVTDTNTHNSINTFSPPESNNND